MAGALCCTQKICRFGRSVSGIDIEQEQNGLLLCFDSSNKKDSVWFKNTATEVCSSQSDGAHAVGRLCSTTYERVRDASVRKAGVLLNQKKLSLARSQTFLHDATNKTEMEAKTSMDHLFNDRQIKALPQR